MKYVRYYILFFSFFITVVSVIIADENPRGNLHGYVFGDYFFKFIGDNVEVSRSQYAAMDKGMNGLQIRRLYLFYDFDISEELFTRVLVEANDETFIDGKTTVFVQEAYIRWKNIIPRHDILIGIIPTPTWSTGFPESTWEYRSIEKTITEFRGLGRASDYGAALYGTFDLNINLKYVAMIGSGSTLRFNDNAYKNYYFMIQAKPLSGLTVEGYVDRWMVAGGFNRSTYKVFAAYKIDHFTFGSELLYQVQENASVFGRHREVLGGSVFLHRRIFENLRVFGRYDYYEPDRNIKASGYREDFFVVGLDYRPVPDVQIMPNLWMNAYAPKSNAVAGKDTDIVLRLSMFYRFR